jgi:predicted branched-subunit amino acid permease
VAVSLPFTIAVAPFGLVFGIAATDAGLDPVQALAFSVFVNAGAAQLAALQLMSEGAPFVVMLLTALAVNLRLAMYSASLAPHLAGASFRARMGVAFFLFDQVYAAAILQYERQPGWAVPAKLAYFTGAVVPITPIWLGGTLLGATVGHQLPAGLPIDQVVPITFLAIIAPMLRTLAHGAAAAVSVVAALALSGVPWSLGLPLAGLLAMLAGAAVEARRERRA